MYCFCCAKWLSGRYGRPPKIKKVLYFLQYFDFSSLRKGHRRRKCIVFAVPNGHRADMGGHQKSKKYYISCSILTFRVSGRAIADKNVLFLLCQMVIGPNKQVIENANNVIFLAPFGHFCPTQCRTPAKNTYFSCAKSTFRETRSGPKTDQKVKMSIKR